LSVPSLHHNRQPQFGGAPRRDRRRPSAQQAHLDAFLPGENDTQAVTNEKGLRLAAVRVNADGAVGQDPVHIQQ
jgi:hypothetical protein